MTRVFTIIRDQTPASAIPKGAVVAMGNFDGVHLGHRAVIAAALDMGKAHGWPALALTFEPHPRRFFSPTTPQFRLTDETAKLRLLAGTGLAGALAGVALMLLLTRGRDDASLGVIDAHIRSMQADHLTDVQTSDQHTVKPWLSAHVDVSPPVRDLKDEGFQLIGGRLDYVDGHPAAAVVYQRAKHVINLFAWASAGSDEPFHDETRQGFNVVTWRRAGIRYYAVSDVEADQLAQFARLVAEGT